MGQPSASRTKADREAEVAAVKRDLDARVHEKFPSVNREDWITLPSRNGHNPWFTRSACGFLRHEFKKDPLVSPAHRMKWLDFMPEWIIVASEELRIHWFLRSSTLAFRMD